MSQWKRAGAACTGLLLVVLAWGLGAQPLPVAKPEQVGRQVIMVLCIPRGIDDGVVLVETPDAAPAAAQEFV